MPKINFKKVAAEVLSVALAVSGVLATIINLAPSVHVAAPYVAWLVSASAVLTGIIAVIRPYASAKFKTMLK